MFREEAEIKASHVLTMQSAAFVTTVKALLFSERKGSHCLVLNRGVISAVFFFFFKVGPLQLLLG